MRAGTFLCPDLLGRIVSELIRYPFPDTCGWPAGRPRYLQNCHHHVLIPPFGAVNAAWAVCNSTCNSLTSLRRSSRNSVSSLAWVSTWFFSVAMSWFVAPFWGAWGVSWGANSIIHRKPPGLSCCLPCRSPSATLRRTVFSLIPSCAAACGIVNSAMLGFLPGCPGVPWGDGGYPGALGFPRGYSVAPLAYPETCCRLLGVVGAGCVQFGGSVWT